MEVDICMCHCPIRTTHCLTVRCSNDPKIDKETNVPCIPKTDFDSLLLLSPLHRNCNFSFCVMLHSLYERWVCLTSPYRLVIPQRRIVLTWRNHPGGARQCPKSMSSFCCATLRVINHRTGVGRHTAIELSGSSTIHRREKEDKTNSLNNICMDFGKTRRRHCHVPFRFYFFVVFPARHPWIW